jgi:hypothetical protein
VTLIYHPNLSGGRDGCQVSGVKVSALLSRVRCGLHGQRLFAGGHGFSVRTVDAADNPGGYTGGY